MAMKTLTPPPKVSLPVAPWELLATEAGRFAAGLRTTAQLWNGELKYADCLNLAGPEERADFAIAASAESGLEPQMIVQGVLTLMAAIEGILRQPPPQPRTTPTMAQLRDRFHVDDRGVWFTPPLDAEGDQPPDVWVCAPLHIVAATRDEDNNNHGHLLEFHDRHGQPQQWAMPLELLEERREYRKVLRRLGLQMNASAAQELQLYLDVCDAEARARCVQRVGWHGTAYVLPNVTIGKTDDERLVLQTLDHRSEGYRQGGTLDGWQTETAACCIGNSRLLLVVSAAFAAPLLTLTGDESGGLHLRGDSSEGKRIGPAMPS